MWRWLTAYLNVLKCQIYANIYYFWRILNKSFFQRCAKVVFTFLAISYFMSALRLTFYPTVSLGAAVFRDPSWLHLDRVDSVPCFSYFHSILFPQSAKNRIGPSSDTTGIKWKKRSSVSISINLCEATGFTVILYPLGSFKINTLSGNYQSVSLPMIWAIYKWTPTSQLQAPPIWIHFLFHNIVLKTKRFCYSKLHSVYELYFNYSMSSAAKILSGRCIISLISKGNYPFPG